MAKVTGLGGVFFKTGDRGETSRWFTEVLGLPTEPWGRVFEWREQDAPEKKGCTVLGLHERASDYFDPSSQPFMLNLRVDDLDGMLEKLRAQGVEVIKIFDPDPSGRFAHVMGPDGIKLELWQPADPDPNEP